MPGPTLTVEQVAAAQPYNPDLLPDLERFVQEQALMALPGPDYTLCMHLIPERITARFREFWNEAARSREITELVPGFESAMQAYAVHLLSISYRRVPRAVLAEAINMEGPALEKYIQSQEIKGWVVSEGSQGQVIELPANDDNGPRVRKNLSESIPLEQVSKLFPIIS
eukprot:jgi/Mesen1/8396/ME000468S07837